MFAAHHRLANLIAIVDFNGQQALGYTDDVLSIAPLADRWRAFGWDVHEVDGHDAAAIADDRRGPRLADGPPHVLDREDGRSARASRSWSGRSSGTTGRCRTTSTGRPSPRSGTERDERRRSSETLIELAGTRIRASCC